MKHWLIIFTVVCLSACTVEFKSNQYDAVASFLSGDRRLIPERKWRIFFEGEEHTAYAVLNGDITQLMSLGYLEVDFNRTYVSAIRVYAPTAIEHRLAPNAQGYVIESDGGARVTARCNQLRQFSEYVYIQACRNDDLGWVYTNELEVNQKREVVYIKTYYSPSKPPLEMYHSPLFEALKKAR